MILTRTTKGATRSDGRWGYQTKASRTERQDRTKEGIGADTTYGKVPILFFTIRCPSPSHPPALTPYTPCPIPSCLSPLPSSLYPSPSIHYPITSTLQHSTFAIILIIMGAYGGGEGVGIDAGIGARGGYGGRKWGMVRIDTVREWGKVGTNMRNGGCFGGEVGNKCAV